MNLRIIMLVTAAVLSPLSNSMVFAQDAAQARPADIEQLRSEMRLNEPLSKDALAECEEAVRQLFTIESISKQYGEGNDPASRPYAFAPLKCTVTFDGMQEPLAIVATPRPGLKRLPKSDRGNGVLPVFSQRNAQVFVSITERTRIKANALRKVDSVPVLFESNPQSMAGARAFLDATKAINTRAAKVPRGWRKHIGQFRSVNKVRGIDGFYEFSTPEEVFLEGIIRENGKIIIPPVYDEVDLIENGFILRTEDNTYGLAALDGQTVLPVEYKSISDQGDGRLQVYDKDQKYSVYDANERAFLGDRYDDLDFIKDANLVVVENDGVHRFLTRDMNSAFDATFSRVMRLTNDRFIVTAEG
ncbi:MAG: WG repeat-containing protein, partial [Pseudomonadota bacterium]